MRPKCAGWVAAGDVVVFPQGDAHGMCSKPGLRPPARSMPLAEDVGYQTDTAFSRAFRREYGEPPASWRRNRKPRRETATS